MSDLINLFPSILLGVMVFLTLLLLPLLGDEPALKRDDRPVESRTLKDDG